MSLGLDIGSKTIKVVELNQEGKNFSLRAAGAVGFSGNGDISQIKDENELNTMAQIIKKLLSDAKISSKKVSISLPETQVYTRIMKFPPLNEQEIASAVKWEAEEYIPIPIKEAVIEHQIIERQDTANPPQVLVLLIAVHQELVEKYINLLGKAGLEVTGVETTLLSLVRSLAAGNSSGIIVDMGGRSTNIAIYKNSELFLARSISTAGDAFTRAVSQSFGISIDQAEQYKRTYGLSLDQLEGKVGNALMPIFKVVVEEIKKTIHYYQTEYKGEAPGSLVLTGGSSGLPGISTALTKTLGLEVIMANPFQKIKLDSDSAKNLANYAPLYSVAVGLAMREN